MALKRRRGKHFEQHLKDLTGFCSDEALSDIDDPADYDEELEAKLKQNEVVGKRKMAEVSVTYSFPKFIYVFHSCLPVKVG